MLSLFCRYENRTQIDLKDFVEYVLKAKAETKYDGTIDGWDQQWSTPNAILFTVSIMTIVGYGNISPKTVNAQVCTKVTYKYKAVKTADLICVLKNNLKKGNQFLMESFHHSSSL